jgi:hypothetical protein
MKLDLIMVCRECGEDLIGRISVTEWEMKIIVAPCGACLEKKGDERFTEGYNLGVEDR